MAKQKYTYGAMSSKFEIEAENKLTAYAVMLFHYKQNAHLLAIYSPEECKADSWMCMDGKISARLDEIYGGEGSFDKYIDGHLEEIKEVYKTIKRIV